MLKHREAWNTAGAVGAALLVLTMFIALSMVVAGCGGDDQSKSRTEVSTTPQKRQATRPVTPPPAAPVTETDTEVAKSTAKVETEKVIEPSGPVTFEEAETAGVLHSGARLLLGRIYLRQGETERARQMLWSVESAYTFFVGMSVGILIVALPS